MLKQLEPKFIDIDGVRYGVSPLPAMKALKMKARLGRIFAPALARLANDDPGGAAETFFGALSGDELEGVTRELLAQATADEVPLFGTGGCFELHFASRTEAVEKLLLFAVQEVNYAGFFAAFGTAIRKMATSLAGAQSSSPTISASSGRPTK